MKLVSNYTFIENNAKINVYGMGDEKDLPECDVIGLEIIPEGGDKESMFVAMRPDEVLLVIKCLSEGLFKTIKSFEYGLLDE